MRYNIKVGSNVTTDIYGPYWNKKDALKHRTGIVKSLGGFRKSDGYTREAYENTVLFKHAVWSTVVITLVEV